MATWSRNNSGHPAKQKTETQNRSIQKHQRVKSFQVSNRDTVLFLTIRRFGFKSIKIAIRKACQCKRKVSQICSNLVTLRRPAVLYPLYLLSSPTYTSGAVLLVVLYLETINLWQQKKSGKLSAVRRVGGVGGCKWRKEGRGGKPFCVHFKLIARLCSVYLLCAIYPAERARTFDCQGGRAIMLQRCRAARLDDIVSVVVLARNATFQA